MTEANADKKRLGTEVEWMPMGEGGLTKDSEIQRVLSGTPLFRDIPKRDWREIEGLFHKRKFSNDEIIFEIGTPGLGAYAILNGEVRIVGEKKGMLVDLARLKEGAFFGEMSLIDDSPRSATAIAVGETYLIGFFRPQLLELMKTRPKLGVVLMQRLAQIMAERLRVANQALAECRDELEHHKMNGDEEAV
ncbi:cyclic nucleotide-binding domain-containing protein [bacterium]|nr:cyclic nucleotide-binding domain-containing protein [bacterium]